MENTVDWWARLLGAAGFALSLLALGFEYVRHRQARPNVYLRVFVEPGHGQHRLKCKLANKGGSAVGVVGWRLESELADEEHTVRPYKSQVMAQPIPAYGVHAFTLLVQVRHAELEQVPYRLRIELATGIVVLSRILQLPVTRPSAYPPG